MSLFSSLAKPRKSVLDALDDSGAVLKAAAKVELCSCVSLVGSLAIPYCSLGLVLGYTLAILKAPAKIILCSCISLVGSLANQLCCRLAFARLRDPAVYEKWYKHAHPFPQLLSRAVYGLPEMFRAEIAKADLVGNPGCYPTSVALGALPALEMGAVADGLVISDSKSGVSGAGRKATLANSFVEVNENLAPYNIGHAHRHVPEIEQTLNHAWQGQGEARERRGKAQKATFRNHRASHGGRLRQGQGSG